MNIEANLWIRRFHPSKGDVVRLVCFPHAGGSASYYFPVSQALSPVAEVLAVQYPGRQDRFAEPCVDDVHELARQIFGNLGPWTDRPLALFGHSMGATVGYEVARLLEEHGTTPVHLFVSSARAPSRRRDERVHRMSDDELIAEMRRLGGTDSSVLGDEDLLRMVLGAVRSDYKAVETYLHRPGPRLECPITALVGDDDPTTTVADAEPWRSHTNAAFDLKVFTGGHFYLNAHTTEMLRIITECLAATAGE
ncbi:alpha/beta fold hydrolase [Nonomuraea sp. NPDC000554]|uniref:thioesterase II family protein n=1 Tax=Nonomuraea sp. NPDC000554 TaxID=3154259 RepID=UPI00332EBAF0